MTSSARTNYCELARGFMRSLQGIVQDRGEVVAGQGDLRTRNSFCALDITRGELNAVFPGPGLETECVDVGLVDFESLLDPLLGILLDVAGGGIFSDDFSSVFRDVSVGGVVSRRAIPQRMQIASGSDENFVASRIALGLRLEKAADTVQRLVDVALDVFEPGQVVRELHGILIAFAHLFDNAPELSEGVRRRLLTGVRAVRCIDHVVVMPGRVSRHIGEAGKQRRRFRVLFQVVIEAIVAFDGVGPFGGDDEGGASAARWIGGGGAGGGGGGGGGLAGQLVPAGGAFWGAGVLRRPGGGAGGGGGARGR